jgi:hypothetical protein
MDLARGKFVDRIYIVAPVPDLGFAYREGELF